MVFWIGLNIISVSAQKYSFFDETVIKGFNVFKDCLGCLTVWYLYDLCNREIQWKNYSFYNYSFFIFAFHGIPTLVLIKISNVLCQGNPYYLFLAYLFIFISVIVTSLFTAKSLNKLFSKAYKILTGSR